MQSSKPTLVIGASENPERYSYRAIQDLQKHQHPVWAIGARQGKVGTTSIETTQIDCPSIDTITLYLSPERQSLTTIISLRCNPRDSFLTQALKMKN